MNGKLRGGKRPGAGRPRAGRKPFTLRMKPHTMRRLREIQEERGLGTTGEVLEQDYPAAEQNSK